MSMSVRGFLFLEIYPRYGLDLSACQVWREKPTYSMFCGRMTKHHLVQMQPVAIKAMFCVKESFSGGRKKSAAPARTTPHFITGALYTHIVSILLFLSTRHIRCAITGVAKDVFCENRALPNSCFVIVFHLSHTYQKCTVLIPTSLVHSRWKIFC